MALIRSEISKYNDIVLALDREMRNRGQKEIAWDSFTHAGERYSPHSVIVGKASDEIKQMGFMPFFAYDKEHLQNAMFPEDSMAPHAHGLTVDELLRLRDMLNNPVAIVTEREGKTRNLGDGEYRCLHFICAYNEDGEQKYYRAIVHPHSHHNGIQGFGYVSKIISFHKMNESRCMMMFNGVVNGDRQLLYFDNKKYLEIKSDMKPVELYDYESRAQSISGHFTKDLNLRRVSQEHQIAVQRAVTAEMNKLVLGKSTYGESFPLFNSSLKALAHGNSFDTIQSAYSTIYKVSKLTQDRILMARTKEYADKSFARSYIRLLKPEMQQDYITHSVNKIGALSIKTQDDLNNMCKEIEDIVAKAPTLDNLKINFSDSVSKVPVIQDAREMSGQFHEKLEAALAEILKDRSVKLGIDINGYDDVNLDQNALDQDEQSYNRS